MFSVFGYTPAHVRLKNKRSLSNAVCISPAHKMYTCDLLQWVSSSTVHSVLCQERVLVLENKTRQTVVLP